MMIKTMTIKKSKIDNYKRWILKKYGLLILFFFYRKQQIASWDGIKRENFVFTSVCFRSGLSS